MKSINVPLNVNWMVIISDLSDRGYTQQKLADKCVCSIPTINRLAKGKNEDPSYSVGATLLQLFSAKKKRLGK